MNVLNTTVNRSIIAILCLLLVCCKKTRDRIQLAPGTVIKLELPYKAGIGNLRVAEKDAGFFFYSFSTRTSKRIDMFDEQGKLLKTISLKNLLKDEAGIDDIAFHHHRFLLLSEKTGNLYTMDTNGSVTGIQHFDAPYQNSIAQEIRASHFNGFILSDSKYLFNCYYYFADTVFPQSYYDYNNHYPYFMEVDESDSNHPVVSYRLPGFYTRFMPEYGINIESAVYTITDRNVLLSSWYTDSLYVADKEKLQITRAVPIRSDYTRLGIEPFIANDTVHIPDDEFNARLQTQGSITNAIYDPYRKYYYITIFHSTTQEKRKKNGPWSFIVLDSAFTQLGEVKMDENKFDSEMLLVLKDGLLFKNINDAANEFQLYKISVR